MSDKSKQSAYQKEWAARNREHLKKQRKEYYQANREKILLRNKKWRDANPEVTKARHYRYYAANKEDYLKRCRKSYFKKNYGITVETYERMVKEVGGKCEVCLRPSRKLHVDHDHATNKIRGILCFSCNSALGNVQDKIYILEWLVEYLEKHGKKF